ncbi:MAG TPA: iron-containing redox enzyme family protein [Acidimicrobiales bacterium]|nr:iron-containing redox enzyme family protein [Acidimicrobiales bacterium]
MQICEYERVTVNAATVNAATVNASPVNAQPTLPRPRGPISSAVIDMLAKPTHPAPAAGWLDGVDLTESLEGDDFHLALYVLYELHYRSFRTIDDRLEWDPRVLRVRGELEHHFEQALRTTAQGPYHHDDIVGSVRDIVDNSGGPSLSTYMATAGTIEDMREFAIHRSAYQLKEADPHTWVLPRLSGRAKAAMVAIQFDEYGLGEQAAMHSELFAGTLRSLGLDPTYGSYVEQLPGSTLATVNLVTMFGLHRRLRGALVGHLAVFEMTSVTPMQRYSRALERMGVDRGARRFYDVHVLADESHQEIALHHLVAGLVEDEPGVGADVVFGARAVMQVEANFARHLLDSWAGGFSSLLSTEPDAVARYLENL